MTTQAEVREWARNNGIEVNQRGAIRSNVMDLYPEAHPEGWHEELAAREANPEIFAHADDLAEAELIRQGKFSPLPAPVPVPKPRPKPTPPVGLSLSEWLAAREQLAALLGTRMTGEAPVILRDAAEAILLDGWTKGGITA